MKRSLALLFVLFGIAAVMLSQYATGSNVLVDYLGTAFGFVRSRYLDTKTTLEDALSIVTGGATGDPDPLDLALPIIADFEGFVGHAYQDAVGVWTIGYGHKIIDGDGFQKNASQTISQATAWDLLRADAQGALECVENGISVDLSVQQIAALTSFCFNVGCGAFTNSTMRKDINSGDLDSAVSEFSRWIYAGGRVLADLQRRRTQEASLFASSNSSDDSGDQPNG